MAVDRATDIFVQEDSRESNPQPGILVPRNLLRFAVIHRRQPASRLRRGVLFCSESLVGLGVEGGRELYVRCIIRFVFVGSENEGRYNAQDAYRTITSLLFYGSRKILRAPAVRRL